MKALVLGASGATGKLVVKQLIKREITTRILIRRTASIPEEIIESPLVETLESNINELDQSEMNKLMKNCDFVISCLGHNLSLKGLFGKPRYLVLDAIKKISESVKNTANKKVKIILMNTTGYTNTLSGEKNSIVESIILSLLMFLLPPHRDNVKAADFLIYEIGKEEEKIEWVAVRLDTLINNEEESAYKVFESPVRSPIFNAGKTSRINVSHFMAELITDQKLWEQWLYKTPVIYND